MTLLVKCLLWFNAIGCGLLAGVHSPRAQNLGVDDECDATYGRRDGGRLVGQFRGHDVFSPHVECGGGHRNADLSLLPRRENPVRAAQIYSIHGGGLLGDFLVSLLQHVLRIRVQGAMRRVRRRCLTLI
jgi:hypothetical protein